MRMGGTFMREHEGRCKARKCRSNTAPTPFVVRYHYATVERGGYPVEARPRWDQSTHIETASSARPCLPTIERYYRLSTDRYRMAAIALLLCMADRRAMVLP